VSVYVCVCVCGELPHVGKTLLRLLFQFEIFFRELTVPSERKCPCVVRTTELFAFMFWRCACMFLWMVVCLFVYDCFLLGYTFGCACARLSVCLQVCLSICLCVCLNVGPLAFGVYPGMFV
jgi:hypothetical protein